VLLAFSISARSSENGTATEPVTGGEADTQAGLSARESGADMAMRYSDVLEEAIVKSIATDWNIRRMRRGVCCVTTGRAGRGKNVSKMTGSRELSGGQGFTCPALRTMQH
jgi:hypothetical protein